MKRLRRWMNGLSVKKKLIIYGYLTVTPVLLAICLVLAFYNYNKVLDEKLESDLMNVNTLAESISVTQTEIKDLTTYICINDDVLEFLTAKNVEAKNADSQVWFEETPVQMVQDMIALKGHIKTIAIYPENGIRPYLRGMDGSVNLQDIGTVRDTETYRKTNGSEWHMLWQRVEKGGGDVYLSSSSEKLVLCREIYDLTQKRPLGYMVMGISGDYFVEMCENVVQSEQESVLILDPQGGELAKAGEIDEEVEAYLKGGDFCRMSYLKRPEHFTCQNYEVICNQTEKNGTIVCKIVPRYSLRTVLREVVYMPLAVLLAVWAALLPLLLIISRSVTGPIGKLSQAIQRFSEGDFNQKLEVSTGDEIGEVAACFNRMVDSIQNLINENYVITLREKESELAALQAQINPHFLYNTLDSLYWQAMGEGNEEIAESILALSQLFRLVLNQGRHEVSVGEELELIARYLQLQKMRFGARLDYGIDVEEGIRRAKIPKLILQPFVENAIVHGFENVTTPCRLTVSAKREGDNLRFEVRDTGIGMRQDQIDAIWEEEPDRYRKQRIGRYAIKNIRERLQLKYKDAFHLEIRSEVGKGTAVVLMLPYEEEEACP